MNRRTIKVARWTWREGHERIECVIGDHSIDIDWPGWTPWGPDRHYSLAKISVVKPLAQAVSSSTPHHETFDTHAPNGRKKRPATRARASSLLP